MRVRVTCAGIVIGTAEFLPPTGLAHALLEPGPGYPFAAAAAQALGRELSRRRLFWPATAGDFAGEAASRWTGDRLAIEDETGRELAVNNLVVLELPTGAGARLIKVVADFRPDLARVAALLRPVGPGGGRTRPAA